MLSAVPEEAQFTRRRVTTLFGADRVSNAVVNHPASSFGLSGECSYLPDTGSHARNNKRILGIDPARRAGPARRPTEEDAKRGEEYKNKKTKKRREKGRPGRRLRRSRSCSALRRRARESALYLTPNQLRSAVPDKAISLLSLSH